MGHITANSPSPVRVVINKPPVIKPESDSEVSIYQEKEPEDSDSDKKITGNNIEESSTSISPEVTPMTIEFTDTSPKGSTLISSEVTPLITELTGVSPEDGTLNHPKVTPIITESAIVFSKDLPAKILSMLSLIHI